MRGKRAPHRHHRQEQTNHIILAGRRRLRKHTRAGSTQHPQHPIHTSTRIHTHPSTHLLEQHVELGLSQLEQVVHCVVALVEEVFVQVVHAKRLRAQRRDN
jgi:hypothetical protein